MIARIFRALFIGGSLVGLADGFRLLLVRVPFNEGPGAHDAITAVASLVGGIGGLCGLLAFFALRPAGAGPGALSYVPAASYLTFFILGVWALAGSLPNRPPGYFLTLVLRISDLLWPVAWPIAGILMFLGKYLKGWRRFVPLAAFLAFPLAIAASDFTGLWAGLRIVYFAAQLMLGLAILQSDPARR